MAGDLYVASLEPSKQLLSYLSRHNLTSDNAVDEQSGKTKAEEAPEEISFDVIRRLAKSLKENDGVHLHELLRDCQIVFHEPPIPPRNEELEARIQILRRKAEEDDYKRMTSSVDASFGVSKKSEFSSDVRMLRSHMAASFNFIVTIAACFLFGFKGSEYILPAPKLAVQLLAGLVTGTIGLLADLYFLVKHLEYEDKNQDGRLKKNVSK